MWRKPHAKLTQGALQLPSINGARAVLIKVSEHSSPILIIFGSAIDLKLPLHEAWALKILKEHLPRCIAKAQ
jgi:hypothetical protein